MDGEQEDARTYQVVINSEEQYSIWYSESEIPAGWKAVGVRGSKADCLAYIESVWIDMRPLSVRRSLENKTAD